VVIHEENFFPIEPSSRSLEVITTANPSEIAELEAGCVEAVDGGVASWLRVPLGTRLLHTLYALILDRHGDCALVNNRRAEVMVRPAQAEHWTTHNP
jgi:hypothetical protein